MGGLVMAGELQQGICRHPTQTSGLKKEGEKKHKEPFQET